MAAAGWCFVCPDSCVGSSVSLPGYLGRVDLEFVLRGRVRSVDRDGARNPVAFSGGLEEFGEDSQIGGAGADAARVRPLAAKSNGAIRRLFHDPSAACWALGDPLPPVA